MSFTLLIWTVLSCGFGLTVASQPGEASKGLARDILSGLAAACIVWAVGLGVWEIVGVIL